MSRKNTSTEASLGAGSSKEDEAEKATRIETATTGELQATMPNFKFISPEGRKLKSLGHSRQIHTE
jgi:hypothetical protein